MDILPVSCDMCHKRMGILIFPDGVHGATIRTVLEALSITTQCPDCDFTAKKQKRDEEQQRQLESKYEHIERHERAAEKE